MYNIIAGGHPSDQFSMHQPRPHTAKFNDIKDLSDLKVGVYWDWVNDASPEVLSSFLATLEHLKQLGVKVSCLLGP